MIDIVIGILILGLFFGAVAWLGRPAGSPIDEQSAQLFREALATLKDARLAAVLSRQAERHGQERLVSKSFRRG